MGMDAALFDMDGLLLDTERLGVLMCKRAGAAFGCELSEALILRTLGTTGALCKEIYHTEHPELPFAEYSTLFRELMLAEMEQNGVPVKPGARELLASLQEKGIPRAVVSSSGESAVRKYLALAGLLDCFDLLVCGRADVPSKPAPDMYLRAARDIGVPPERCLVLEDSPNGLRSGRAAGCVVCMVPDLIPYTEALAPYCDHVVPSLIDVIALL